MRWDAVSRLNAMPLHAIVQVSVVDTQRKFMVQTAMCCLRVRSIAINVRTAGVTQMLLLQRNCGSALHFQSLNIASP